MGDFNKHINLARQKLRVSFMAYSEKQMTAVGDLGTKVVEQLVEADAARINKHFGDHRSRHAYSNENFPNDRNKAMRKIWFAYADLGYDGVNGNRAKQVIENLKKIVTFFEERFGIKIHEKDI